MDKLDFIKQAMQQAVGITDEDFKTHISFPQNMKLAEATPEFMKSKIVAEVIETKYCSAGLKKGQKYTFQALPAVLLPEESDAPVCARGLGPLGNMIEQVWQGIMAGNVKETYEVGCLDPGVAKGGLGHVVFKVSVKQSE